MNARLSAELIGMNFVAAYLGGPTGQCGLVGVGSAEVEECDGRWHVTAHVLGDDGYTSRYTMPDSFAEKYQAERLADSLNETATA